MSKNSEKRSSSQEQDFADSRNEILRVVHNYLITKEQRNKILAESPLKAAGCTSISLSYLLDSFSQPSPALYPYKAPTLPDEAHIYLIPTETVFAQLQPREFLDTSFYRGKTIVDVFSSNESYGRLWALYALLRRMGLSDEEIYNTDIFDVLVFGYKILAKINLKNAETLDDWERETWQTAQITAARHNITLMTYLSLAKSTQGIQMLYQRSEEFIEFLRTNIFQITDDVTLELRTPIPLKYILGIVPLGTYEQNFLIKSSN